MNKHLAQKINQMAREDLAIRKNHAKGKALDIRIEKRHTDSLKKIIERHGWPTISLAGKKASTNAWLLAQHADHDNAFQKTALRLMSNVAPDINMANIAYLSDRLLIAEKKKQRFGTQFDFDEKGLLILHPVKNLKGVDKLRKQYNLPPIQKFMDMAKEFNAKHGNRLK